MSDITIREDLESIKAFEQKAQNELIWRMIEAARLHGIQRKLSLFDFRELATAAEGFVPAGRVSIEMDDAEYARMKAALGPDWEWQCDRPVILRVGRTPDAPTGESE